METHVKVLAALEIAMGGLGLFAAFLLMLVFGGVASAIGISGDPDATIALPVIGFTGTALVTFLIVLSLPGIITGIGLFRLRPWSRIAGIVLSILGLVVMPFGTILGAYGLWVLFSKETERLFSAPSVNATLTP
jgi:hypothetical protein